MMGGLLSAQNALALLPALSWQQWWTSAGWSVAVAWFAAWLLGRWATSQKTKVAIALILAIWVWLPGPWGGSHWLGLAFQAPAVTTVLFCALSLMHMLHRSEHPQPLRQIGSFQQNFLALCGIAMGWALLLDTLGVFSSSFYNWGFGSVAPALVLGIGALPWVVAKKGLPHSSVAVLGVATMSFVVLRLPTGNLFDALMDPWLWCYLQFAFVQQWRHALNR